MEKITTKQQIPILNKPIEQLLKKSHNWISEIEFIKVEQEFLRELLGEHVIGLCTTNNFQNAKLLLKGLEHENNLGTVLINSIKEHNVNLSLLIENIYLKREDNFRKNHENLKNEVIKYIENFKNIKKQVFELILLIMKKEKQQKLLTK